MSKLHSPIQHVAKIRIGFCSFALPPLTIPSPSLPSSRQSPFSQSIPSSPKAKPKGIITIRGELKTIKMASTVIASSSSSATSQFLSNGRRTGPPPPLPLIPKVVVMAAKSDSRRTAATNKTSLPRRLLDSLPQKAAAIAAAAAAASPLPALAEQMEKAALFDFNLTLPAIAVEFLLLMVALDKLYFTPLGKFMDERDSAIRAKLGDVKDTSGEVKQLEEQAAAVMRAARAEISAALNKMKKEMSAEMEQKLAEGRKRVEVELAEALQNLEKQKEDTIKALDSQIAALSDEIVKKVLPTP